MKNVEFRMKRFLTNQCKKKLHSKLLMMKN